MQIDCFFAVLSPYLYLAGPRFAAIAARHGANVTYKPVDGYKLFARTGGVPLAERHESRRSYREQDLTRQARRAALQLTLNPAHWPVNPAPASYAILSAQATGADVGGLVFAFGRATWAEQRDIADDAVVRDVLAAAGFAPDLADKGLLEAADAYAANLEEAVSRGVFGSPFYIVDGEKFWGQDRLEDLDLNLSGKL